MTSSLSECVWFVTSLLYRCMCETLEGACSAYRYSYEETHCIIGPLAMQTTQNTEQNQKTRVHSQKSPVDIQKETCFIVKPLAMHTAENKTKNSPSKKLYTHLKEPYTLSKEPYIHSKEPYTRSKEPYRLSQNSLHTFIRVP